MNMHILETPPFHGIWRVFSTHHISASSGSTRGDLFLKPFPLSRKVSDVCDAPGEMRNFEAFFKAGPSENWVHQYLVGGIPTPLENMSSSVGMMTFPKYGKNKISKCSKPPTSPTRYNSIGESKHVPYLKLQTYHHFSSGLNQLNPPFSQPFLSWITKTHHFFTPWHQDELGSVSGRGPAVGVASLGNERKF